MQHFVGTFECKADDKGRIMLPMSLKKQLSDKLKNGFVIKRAVFNQCLELYPIKEWDSLMERINNLNRFNKKNIDFIRRFTAGVRQIDIDISGRILIPKDLINHAKIKNNVLFVGLGKTFQICEPKNFEKFKSFARKKAFQNRSNLKWENKLKGEL